MHAFLKSIILKLSLSRTCQHTQMPEVLILFHRHLNLGYKASLHEYSQQISPQSFEFTSRGRQCTGWLDRT